MMKSVKWTSAIGLALALLGAAPAAMACPTGCCFFVIADPGNTAQQATILSTATVLTSLYSFGTTIMHHITGSMGAQGAISSGPPTPTLPDSLVDLAPITGIGNTVSPDLQTTTTATNWIGTTLFAPLGANAATVGIVNARRQAAAILAIQHAFAVAEASQAALVDAPAQAQAALQQGNSAATVREQVAAVIKTVDIVRAELVDLEEIDAAIVELKAATAFASGTVPITWATAGATPTAPLAPAQPATPTPTGGKSVARAVITRDNRVAEATTRLSGCRRPRRRG